MKYFARLFLVMALFLSSAALAAEPDDILGLYWKGDRESIIEVYKGDQDLYHGQVVWRYAPLADVNNPNPDLRERSVIGMDFMKGFHYDPQSGQWTGGEVYAPDSGKTYRGNIWLEDQGQTLMMRGFVGIPLFGRTASFKRLAPDETIPE